MQKGGVGGANGTRSRASQPWVGLSWKGARTLEGVSDYGTAYLLVGMSSYLFGTEERNFSRRGFVQPRLPEAPPRDMRRAGSWVC